MRIVERLRAAGCVFAEDEAQLILEDNPSLDTLEIRIRRRETGEPIEHVLGWSDFLGHRIIVQPGVFVPRVRTELLARRALDLAASCRSPLVVDLCCGSGAIGLVIARTVLGVRVVATDIDPAAVDCARRNLGTLGVVYGGDLFHALPIDLKGRVDVLVANVPYVPTASIPFLPADARDFEPGRALDGGKDGLVVFRRVAAAAPDWLAAGGHLLMETSDLQANHARAILQYAGFGAVVEHDDEIDATIVVGKLDQSV